MGRFGAVLVCGMGHGGWKGTEPPMSLNSTKTLIGSPLEAGKADRGRDQRIYTPDSILEVCRGVWPEGIHLDPCTDAEAPKFSDTWFTYPNWNGLEQPWTPRTYINPPFLHLKAWLEYGLTQPREQIWLIPVRPHRTWWIRFVEQCDVICWLRGDFKFRGYKSPYPVPMALVYRGVSCWRFEKQTRELGKTWVSPFGANL